MILRYLELSEVTSPKRMGAYYPFKLCDSILSILSSHSDWLNSSQTKLPDEESQNKTGLLCMENFVFKKSEFICLLVRRWH